MRTGFLGSLAELWRYRDLLRELAGREMKLRYRRSSLGFVWSLLTPLYQIVIYTFVFKYVMHFPEKNLSVNILVGLIPWTFFSVGILNSCAAIMRLRNVVKKVYFPRQMAVLSTVGANLVHLLLSIAVMLVVFLVIPIHISPQVWFLVPLIFFQTLLVVGIGLLVCAAHTYYGDVEYVVANVLQVGMFLTPVVYPLTMLDASGRLVERIDAWPEFYQTIYKLNPMTIYAQGWRDLLLPLQGYHAQFPDPTWLGITIATSLGVFLLGLAVWRRYEWRFPEVI